MTHKMAATAYVCLLLLGALDEEKGFRNISPVVVNI